MKRILHIDDSEDDLFLTRHYLEKAGIVADWHAIPGGVEGMEYLCGAGKYKDREAFPVPDVVLLDLKMPGLDGRAGRET